MDKLQQDLLIALLPACARQSELTDSEHLFMRPRIIQALERLKAAGLVAKTMLTEKAPVWTLTPAGRKKARMERMEDRFHDWVQTSPINSDWESIHGES